MISFNSPTDVTFSHILCNLALHSSPPKILLQVLVHFALSWMDNISRAMCFMHDLLMELEILWKH
jgi:hypothetical protein